MYFFYSKINYISAKCESSGRLLFNRFWTILASWLHYLTPMMSGCDKNDTNSNFCSFHSSYLRKIPEKIKKSKILFSGSFLIYIIKALVAWSDHEIYDGSDIRIQLDPKNRRRNLACPSNSSYLFNTQMTKILNFII